MGVTGLWSILEPVNRPVKLETLANKRLAIDASIWIYQFLKAVRDKEGEQMKHSHIVGFFRRICKLLYFGIKPVFVFDGGAPMLKRQTIRKRQARRITHREDATRIANKILALQMRKRAFQERESRLSPQKGTTLTSKAIQAPSSMTIDVETVKVAVQESQKFAKADPYQLPEMGVSFDKLNSKSDPRIMSQSELADYASQFGAQIDISMFDFANIDFDSEMFKSLSDADKYNILNAARLRSRLRMGLTTEQLSEMFPNRMEFSKFQIERLKERNELTQRLMDFTGMNKKGPLRIASERDREYILVRNDGVEGGWALGVISNQAEKTENKNVVLPQSSELGNSEFDVDDEDDFEDIPIPHKVEHLKPREIVSQKLREIRMKQNNDYENDAEIEELMLQKAMEESFATQSSKKKTLFNLNANDFMELKQSLTTDEKQNSQEETTLPTILEEADDSNEKPEKEEETEFLDALPAFEAPSNVTNEVIQDVSGLPFEPLELDKSLFFKPRQDTEKTERPPSPSLLVDPNTNKGDELPSELSIDAVSILEPNLPSEIKLAQNATQVVDIAASPMSPKTENVSEKIKSDEERDTNFPVETLFESSSPVPKQAASSITQDEPSPFVLDVRQTFPQTQETEENTAVVEEKELPLPTETLFELSPQLPKQVTSPEEQNGKQNVLQTAQTQQIKEEPVSSDSIDVKVTEQTTLPKEESVAEPAKPVKVEPLSPQIKDIAAEKPSVKPVPIKLDDQEPDTSITQELLDDEDLETLVNLADEEKDYDQFVQKLQSNAPAPVPVPVNKDWNEQDFEARLHELRQSKKNETRDADEVNQEMVRECQELLRYFGLPYIVAPQEAEAQCAKLLELKLVDGVVTDDSDVFLFGGTRIYRNMFNQSKFVELYLSSDMERDFAIGRKQLIQLAYLLGSDYTEGLSSVGPVSAVEILREFPGDNPLIEFKRWFLRIASGSPLVNDLGTPVRRRLSKLVGRISLPTNFPDPVVEEAYLNPTVDDSKQEFQWGIPDLDQLRDFLMTTIGWSQAKTDQVLVPVIQDMTRKQFQGTQTNLTQFFSGQTPSTAVHAPRVNHQFKSKRLHAALTSFQTASSEKTASTTSTIGTETPTIASQEHSTASEEPELSEELKKRIERRRQMMANRTSDSEESEDEQQQQQTVASSASQQPLITQLDTKLFKKRRVRSNSRPTKPRRSRAKK
ncbi:DNA repair nuclease Rad13 [Schizosaccharomyces japonicus yFS275]|uniref:DNA repair nuclease Rad13 n=1 Tax=Schizosaccharomyces japonicus (strain yFS275 / FY16936) TaxID=402676 RepID=B6JZJ1_SCHJY|nr:DNA repair nuclease Rad13 [Schizosaccharomyces japonicus yFS275]EEB06959.1 DNA repair nuclease Rad13 [Schizosaccharomyces japonicus yFS275]